MNEIQTDIGSRKPPVGELPEICWLPCSGLLIDHAYQRMAEEPASKRLIRHIAENWDWRLCGTIAVSERTGDQQGLYVIDGQHRLLAAIQRGDIGEMPCTISKFDGIEDEARLFVALNSARRQVGEVEKFHARVASKDHCALDAKRVIQDCGMTVARYTDAQFWKPLECGFPTIVERTIRKREEHAHFALEVLARAYPDKALFRGQAIFEGLVWLWYKEQLWFDEMTRDDMAECIGEKSQREWVNDRSRLRMDNPALSPSEAMGRLIGQTLELDTDIAPKAKPNGASHTEDARAAGFAMSVNAGLMAINGDHKLEALDAFEDIAASIEKLNGISIAEGMAATGLAYHCFYAAALQLNVMGKIRLIRGGGQIRLVAPPTSYPKEAQLFTSTANTARELRSFLADLTTGRLGRELLFPPPYKKENDNADAS